MTDLVSTDLQGFPTRRLQKKFGSNDKAIGTSAPNTLHSNKPNLNDAMGITSGRGILSIIHDGSTQDITLYLWNAEINKVDASKGWVKVAESAALYAKNAEAHAILSFKVHPGLAYFLQAGSSTITNCWVADAKEHPLNPNTDKTYAA